MEMEIRNLQDKLTANQKALDASKQELHNLKKSSSELDRSLKSSREEVRTAQTSLVAFKEQIATLLSGRSAIVKPSEKAILERIQEINCKEKSKEIVSQQLLHLLNVCIYSLWILFHFINLLECWFLLLRF